VFGERHFRRILLFRPHSTFNGRTPDEFYAMQESEEKLAA
jgi:hypothetical protein